MKQLLLTITFLSFSFPVQAAILNIKEVKSKGGITAWLVEDHSIPVISMKYSFNGAGAVNDPQDLQGLSRLLSNTLDEGAGDYTSQQFQGLLDNKSISLSFSASRDDFGGNLKTLTKNRDEAFSLLQLALTKPRFDQEAVNRMIAANVTRIRSDMTEPDWVAARLLNSVIYDGHPYAMNSGGTLSSLPQITPAHLKEKLAKDLTRDRLIVSVAGDISEADLSILLDKTFGQLPAKAAAVKISDVKFAGQPTTTLLKLPIPQTIIMATLPGIRIGDPDYFAADIMNFILGSSGFGSRLTEIIREKNGLTYGIYTGMDMMDYAAIFTLSTSTENKNVAQLMDLSRKEFERIKAEKVTIEEIRDAQSYLIGSTPLNLTSTDQIAGTMLTFQRYNLPKNYLDIREAGLNKVTPEDVERAANRLLDLSKLSVIMVGDPANITPTKTVTDLPNVK
ncbi:MAG: insulinase family protein [Micavibrio aeruginosavorus]|uniref:Insulinase family protein n=1 Tax=Micavibrio aeruginosavorus TaxID=349221 RepID=A0A2W5FPR1_9BACT|nr:MAG: insulinase family protein [Micavibrio aeruginosavorus]